MNSKIAVAAVFAAILAALFATPQAALAADVSVDITSGSSTKTTDAFAPNPVQANVGDTIIWTNRDSTVHTATSGGASGGPTGLFGGSASEPAIIAPSGTQRYTVTEAGDIPYYCVLHPTMVGTITVSDGVDYEISVRTDSSSYSNDDVVAISGEAFPPVDGQPVFVRVLSPDGEVARSDAV